MKKGDLVRLKSGEGSIGAVERLFGGFVQVRYELPFGGTMKFWHVKSKLVLLKNFPQNKGAKQ